MYLLVMTQEKKELLLKDLCSRLPYKVKVQDTYYKSLEPAPIWLLDLNAQSVRMFADEGYQHIEYIKPYLFPLSSMTEEQFEELKDFAGLKYEGNTLELVEWDSTCDKTLEFWLEEIPSYCVIKVFDWLNKNHFDYRGLISMGLAIDATGKNIY